MRRLFPKVEYERVAEFRYTLRRFLRFSEQVAARNGVRPQQYQALLAIEGYPGRDYVTVGELAERLQVAHHSAVGLADRLEEAGMIRRKTDLEDARKVWLSLTPTGHRVLEKIYRLHREELHTVGPRLGRLLGVAARRITGEVAS